MSWCSNDNTDSELTLLNLSKHGRALTQHLICEDTILSQTLRWESRGSQFARSDAYRPRLVLRKQVTTPRYYAHHVQQYTLVEPDGTPVVCLTTSANLSSFAWGGQCAVGVPLDDQQLVSEIKVRLPAGPQTLTACTILLHAFPL